MPLILDKKQAPILFKGAGVSLESRERPQWFQTEISNGLNFTGLRLTKACQAICAMEGKGR